MSDTASKFFVLIERDYSENLAIQYDDEQQAARAMEHSFFIDSLCLEDCLDCWVGDDAERIALGDFEIVLPPEDDHEIFVDEAEKN